MTDSMDLDPATDPLFTNFLNLPYEIRLQIYELYAKDFIHCKLRKRSQHDCFDRDSEGRGVRWIRCRQSPAIPFQHYPAHSALHDPNPSDPGPFPRILLANKQISHEVRLVLYRYVAIEGEYLETYFGASEKYAEPAQLSAPTSAGTKRGRSGSAKQAVAKKAEQEITTQEMARQLGLSNMNPNMLKFTFIRSFTIDILGYWDYAYDLSWIFRDLADLQDGLIAKYGATYSSPEDRGLPLKELVLDFRQNDYAFKYNRYKYALSNFFCRRSQNAQFFPIPHLQRLRGLRRFKIGRWEATEFDTMLWDFIDRAFRARRGQYCQTPELQDAIRTTHAIITAPHGDETAAALAAQLVVGKPPAKKRKTAK